MRDRAATIQKWIRNTAVVVLMLLAAMEMDAQGVNVKSGSAAQRSGLGRRRAAQVTDVATPLNHLFSSHYYYSDSQVTRVSVEIRVRAWGENDRPWRDTAWTKSVGLTPAATFPIRVWRRRGDFLCAVQTFEVPIHPDAQWTLPVDVTRFRSGDWFLLEPSDAFVISSWTRESSVSRWDLMTELKTNASFDWRTPRASPPWGNQAPYVDCNGGEIPSL